MKLRILIDNHENGILAGEWGLAVWIEHEGKKILLDTGATGLFADNAEKMGVDLKTADLGVLSHAHYDHSDGLARFFAENEKAVFWLRSGCGEDCYGRKPDGMKYIGIHPGWLTEYRERIRYAEGDAELSHNVYLIPHKTANLAKIGERSGMFVRRGEGFAFDDFSHEQSLVLRTRSGLAVFNSCCHGGAANIVREVEQTFPGERVCALIGGFHLYESTDEEILALAEQLKALGTEHVVTGHCTGDHALALLKDALGERVQQMYSGFELEIP